jgi:hypothetical protein
MVVIKLVVNVSSENRRSKQLFPTPGNLKREPTRLSKSFSQVTRLGRSVKEKDYIIQHIDKDGSPSVCQGNIMGMDLHRFLTLKINILQSTTPL